MELVGWLIDWLIDQSLLSLAKGTVSIFLKNMSPKIMCMCWTRSYTSIIEGL